MDKATMLAETVQQVRELRKTVPDLEGVCGGSSKDCVFPGGADKLSLENGDGDNDQGLVKVTFSCEDRPGLISAVARTLRSMKGRVVKFEMVTLGGRTKSVLWVQGLSGGNEGTGMLRRALKSLKGSTCQGLARGHGSLDDYKFFGSETLNSDHCCCRNTTFRPQTPIEDALAANRSITPKHESEEQRLTHRL
ncbi:hypothetical protein RGQ29_022077 [Quercus rubra]|uniref:ACT domain-containing protein n=1 Tax=Quercus rubra TaxID=3512 RepID=A0AAN7IRP5_QUERU|nr:hypothetical protein RGQ29_022077 [Quercus rubra]